MRHRIARLLAPLAAAVLALLASLPALAATVPVAMLTFPLSFEPKTAVVNVGDTVTWNNPGPAPHTATSVTGAFNSGFVAAGNSFSHTFSQGGVFQYFCAIGDHRAQGMEGTVLVLDAPIAPRALLTATRLLGAEENPPVNTRAGGSAFFRLAAGGTALEYTLSASGLADVTLAHIHFGQRGVNGPVVVDLLAAGTCNTIGSGVQCSGTITADELLGPLAGKSLGHLLGAMKAGHTYVNVHSTAHPGGEVRGQLDRVSVIP
jgi:plastocyanin